MSEALPVCTAVVTELMKKYGDGTYVILKKNRDSCIYRGINEPETPPTVLAHSEKDEGLEALIARFRKEKPDVKENVYSYEIGSGWIASAITEDSG